MLPAHPRSDIEYRLALYWHDGGGVGHFVRQARIADAVLAQAPGSTVFGISGSSGLADHLLPRNVDTVKLPSFVLPEDIPSKGRREYIHGPGHAHAAGTPGRLHDGL